MSEELKQQLAKGVQLAITAAGGKASQLAKKIGTSHQRVINWEKRDGKIPAEMVPIISVALGIARHDLRPDLYVVEQSYPQPAA